MRTTFLILLSFFTLFSCTNDISELESTNPNILSEFHILYNGEISNRYIFDVEGRMIRYVNLNNNYISNYTYDSSNKLINITLTDIQENILESKDILYDSENRISQIGEKVLTYDATTNSLLADHVDNSSTFIDNVTGETWLNVEETFNKYHFAENNNLNPIIHMSNFDKTGFSNLSTGISSIVETLNANFSTIYHHDNMNLIYYGKDSFFTQYNHGDSLNPLYDDYTNLKYVYGFLTDNNEHLNYLLCKNNIINIHWDNDGGAEETAYQYDFNSLNLPTKRYTKLFYGGIPETEWFLSARYYYQGDEIPN